MPGKLVIVGRPDAATFWTLVGAGLSAAEAAPVAQGYLTAHPAGRVAICQAIRSFASTANVLEDVDPKVDA